MPPPSEIDLGRMLEMRTAERDAALVALENLEAMVVRVGGYMSTDDQATLADARFVLEHQGRRRIKRTTWTNRP